METSEFLKKKKLLNMGVLALPFILASSGLYFYSRPYTYVVRGEAAIVCSNNQIYPVTANNIQRIDALEAYIQNAYKDDSVVSEDIQVRKLCAYGVIHDFIPFRPVPKERNYTIRPGISGPTIDVSRNSGVILSNK